MRSNASRWPAPIIALALLLPLLTGCAIDKGTALAADFEERWAGTSDVAEVRTTKNNTLPFSGSTVGVLVLKDGISPDRVAERAEELREYVARNESVTGRIMADGITVTVDADAERFRDVMTLWRSLTADARVVDGDISGSTYKRRYQWRFTVTAVDAAGAMAVFDDLIAAGGRHQPTSDTASVKVGTGRGVRPGVAVESDVRGGLPTGAIAAYEAVVAQYPIDFATMKSAYVGFVVADAADQDGARELAQRAAPGLRADAISVTAPS